MKEKILHFLFTCLPVAFVFSANAQGGTLPLNNHVSGNLTSSTADIWNVTTNADGLLRLTFKAVSPADLYVTLYDNDGITPLSSSVESFNNSTVTLVKDGLAPGTYHVKITPFGTSFGSYTLADSLFKTPLANDVEPNGSAASALVLPQNNKRTGHVGYYYNHLTDTTDWYKVTTTADGLLRVYLTTVSGSIYSTTTTNPLDVIVSLYDNDGTTQLGNVEVYNGSNGATNLITKDGLAPGTYYIKVQNFSTNEFANYTITDSLFTTPLANDAEPNGTAATALVLPLNGKKTGHVGYYYNHLSDTTDWYKVTTTADGLLRVYLTTDSGSIYSSSTSSGTNPLDVNLTLYDNDGTTQLGHVEVFNAYKGASGLITKDGLAPGTYYIKIQNFSTTEFANYMVFDSLFTTPLANDAEPNGTAASAVVLPLNGKKTGHVGYYYNHKSDTTDWYKVTTTANGLLRVYLTTDSGSIYSTTTSSGTDPLDVNLSLYDNNGTTQLGFVEVFNGYKGATGMITKDGLAPGTYYIKVQNFSTTEFANYTVSDTLFTTSLTNDAEPNGTAATAIVLPLNGKKTGNVGYYYNNQRDTADWYKVTTTADGLLRVYLATDSGSVYSTTGSNGTDPLDVNLSLYDNDGTTQLGFVEVFNGYKGATSFLTKDGLAAGTYYIKIQNFSTAEFANYTVTDSLFTTSLPNDAESNGSSATAKIFPLNSNIKGHVGYYYNQQRDTADWYKITTPADGPLHLYLSMQKGSIYSTTGSNGTDALDMVMTVYRSDGTQIGFKEVFNGYGPATDSIVFATLNAGTYFVKITNFSTNEFAIYSLINFVTSESGSLPVTFINFDGVLQGGKALLTWSTATEINDKGFDVERSTDGRTFTSIGFVDGMGNSSTGSSYSFTDSKVVTGYNYYRLKQVDMDGHFNFSSTIRLDFKQFDWTVFGNPLTNNSWIQLQLPKTSDVSIRIITIDGKIVKSIRMGIISEGTYSIPLNSVNLRQGIYIVQLITDNETFSKKIVK